MPLMTQNEIIEIIRQAGKQKKTLWIRAYESNGSVEPREVEPYSFRPKGTTEKVYFHCLLHNGIRNFSVDKIIEVQITENSFVPRYDVEFQIDKTAEYHLPRTSFLSDVSCGLKDCLASGPK